MPKIQNNSVPAFSDQEILTIYLFVGSEQHYTKIKGIKGATEEEKQRNKAADDMFSSAVSSVREPVEAFFS